jgi:hypothetical protein
MATACRPQLTFECSPKTKTVVRFDQAQASTDGGVVVLKALDACLQLTDRLAACLPDRRDPDKVRHAVRDPMTGATLASQPTRSRFEHAVDPRALYGMGATLADGVIAQHRPRLKGRARRITLDLDPTDDPPMGNRPWPSSRGTTTRGAICPWWRH